MRLTRRVVHLELEILPRALRHRPFSPDQRERANRMLARAWQGHETGEDNHLFEHVVRTCRERGAVGEPNASWFRLT